jgi:hypothetical protein
MKRLVSWALVFISSFCFMLATSIHSSISLNIYLGGILLTTLGLKALFTIPCDRDFLIACYSVLELVHNVLSNSPDSSGSVTYNNSVLHINSDMSYTENLGRIMRYK